MTGSETELSVRADAADEWLTPGRFALLLGLLIFATFPGVLLGGATFVIRDFGMLVIRWRSFTGNASGGANCRSGIH